jgi:hypothetical protein
VVLAERRAQEARRQGIDRRTRGVVEQPGECRTIRVEAQDPVVPTDDREVRREAAGDFRVLGALRFQVARAQLAHAEHQAEHGDDRQRSLRRARARQSPGHALDGADGPRRDRAELQERAQVRLEIRRARVATLRVAVHALIQDRDQVPRQSGPVADRGQRIRARELRQHLRRRAFVRRVQGQQVVERRGEAVHVARRRAPHAALQRFGRHVGWRAEARGRACRLALVVEQRDAEVEEHGASVTAHEHVRRLDVAVQHARLVHGLQARGEVGGPAHDGAHVARLAAQRDAEFVMDPGVVVAAAVSRVLLRGVEDLGQGRPVDHLHDDEDLVLSGAPAVVDRHDGRVLHRGHRLRFALEALQRLLRRHQPVVHDLARHLAPEVEVLGQVHDAHRARTDAFEQAEASAQRSAAQPVDLVRAAHPRRQRVGARDRGLHGLGEVPAVRARGLQPVGASFVAHLQCTRDARREFVATRRPRITLGGDRRVQSPSSSRSDSCACASKNARRAADSEPYPSCSASSRKVANPSIRARRRCWTRGSNRAIAARRRAMSSDAAAASAGSDSPLSWSKSPVSVRPRRPSRWAASWKRSASRIRLRTTVAR